MTERPRVVLITGAASGIGAALCVALAAPGVAILAHTRERADALAQTAAAIRAAGGLAVTALGDLADPALPAHLVALAVQHFGGLDVVVSNAGFADRTPLADLTDDRFAASTEAIQGAFLRLARAAAPHLAEGRAQRRDARLIAVSSFVAHAFRPDLPLFIASAAAKAGLEALVRALAVELGPAGVTVNAVVPGFIAKDRGTRGLRWRRSRRPPRRPASRSAASARRPRSRRRSPSLLPRQPATSPASRCTSMAA